jgi:hypothetical protein
MNKLVLTPLLLCLAMTAHAEAPVANDPGAAAPTTEPATAQAAQTVPVVGEHDRLRDRHCLPETGTRIRSKRAGGCVYSAGVWYSREDIERTGAQDIGTALQYLDPSITIWR